MSANPTPKARAGSSWPSSWPAGSWPEAGVDDGVVRLRRLVASDADAYLALFDAEALRWSPRRPDSSPKARREALDKVVSVDGVPTAFAVADADDPDARLLGVIDYRVDAPVPPFGHVDIGYSVGSWARGRRVATRALRLLGDWLLSPEGLDLHRVQLDHAVENVASCRVAVGGGLPIEGRRPGFLPLRESDEAPVVFHDICQHGRLRAG